MTDKEFRKGFNKVFGKVKRCVEDVAYVRGEIDSHHYTLTYKNQVLYPAEHTKSGELLRELEFAFKEFEKFLDSNN